MMLTKPDDVAKIARQEKLVAGDLAILYLNTRNEVINLTLLDPAEDKPIKTIFRGALIFTAASFIMVQVVEPTGLAFDEVHLALIRSLRTSGLAVGSGWTVFPVSRMTCFKPASRPCGICSVRGIAVSTAFVAASVD